MCSYSTVDAVWKTNCGQVLIIFHLLLLIILTNLICIYFPFNSFWNASLLCRFSLHKTFAQYCMSIPHIYISDKVKVKPPVLEHFLSSGIWNEFTLCYKKFQTYTVLTTLLALIRGRTQRWVGVRGWRGGWRRWGECEMVFKYPSRVY